MILEEWILMVCLEIRKILQNVYQSLCYHNVPLAET